MLENQLTGRPAEEVKASVGGDRSQYILCLGIGECLVLLWHIFRVSVQDGPDEFLSDGEWACIARYSGEELACVNTVSGWKANHPIEQVKGVIG